MDKRIGKSKLTNGRLTCGMREDNSLDPTDWMGEKRETIEREKKEERKEKVLERDSLPSL